MWERGQGVRGGVEDTVRDRDPGTPGTTILDARFLVDDRDAAFCTGVCVPGVRRSIGRPPGETREDGEFTLWLVDARSRSWARVDHTPGAIVFESAAHPPADPRRGRGRPRLVGRPRPPRAHPFRPHRHGERTDRVAGRPLAQRTPTRVLEPRAPVPSPKPSVPPVPERGRDHLTAHHRRHRLRHGDCKTNGSVPFGGIAQRTPTEPALVAETSGTVQETPGEAGRHGARPLRREPGQGERSARGGRGRVGLPTGTSPVAELLFPAAGMTNRRGRRPPRHGHRASVRVESGPHRGATRSRCVGTSGARSGERNLRRPGGERQRAGRIGVLGRADHPEADAELACRGTPEVFHARRQGHPRRGLPGAGG